MWTFKIVCIIKVQGFPDSSVGKESTCNAGDPGLIPGLGRSAGEGIGYPLQYPWASLVAQLVKNLPAMQETGLIPRLGRSPGEEKVYPLQYSGLKNSMDCIDHGVTESDLTEQLSLMVQKIYILSDRCFKSCLLYVSYLLWLNPRVVCWGLTGKMGFYLTTILYFKLIMFFQFCYFLLQAWS